MYILKQRDYLFLPQATKRWRKLTKDSKPKDILWGSLWELWNSSIVESMRKTTEIHVHTYFGVGMDALEKNDYCLTVPINFLSRELVRKLKVCYQSTLRSSEGRWVPNLCRSVKSLCPYQLRVGILFGPRCPFLLLREGGIRQPEKSTCYDEKRAEWAGLDKKKRQK